MYQDSANLICTIPGICHNTLEALDGPHPQQQWVVKGKSYRLQKTQDGDDAQVVTARGGTFPVLLYTQHLEIQATSFIL